MRTQRALPIGPTHGSMGKPLGLGSPFGSGSGLFAAVDAKLGLDHTDMIVDHAWAEIQRRSDLGVAVTGLRASRGPRFGGG